MTGSPRNNDVARAEGARLWDLRAATSLARLRAADGERAAARAVLAETAGLLPVAADLPDVTAARVLAATRCVAPPRPRSARVAAPN